MQVPSAVFPGFIFKTAHLENGFRLFVDHAVDFIEMSLSPL
jgi:hypothetical protein